MIVHSRWVRGSLVFYHGSRNRLLHAFGGNVFQWEASPKEAQATAASGTDPVGYSTTVVEAGAGTSEVEASDEAGIVWEIITAAAENDGLTVQLNGEAFLPANRDIYYGIKLEANEATQIDFFVGLGITNTNPLGGITDAIYFEKLDGGTGISCVTEKNNTETQTDNVGVLAADTPVELEFYFSGTTVSFYVNGSRVAQHTANIPDDEELSPIIQVLAGDANARRAKIHWARAIQIG